MICRSWSLVVLLMAALTPGQAFVPPTRPTLRSRSPSLMGARRAPSALQMSAFSPEVAGALTHVSSLLAYADDKATTLNGSIIGASLIGTTAALVVVFSLLAKNLQGKKFAFDLTPEEEAAVSAVDDLFDPTAEDKVLTESGIVGYVKRRSAAEEAKAAYQKGKSDRDVRDKTLRYAEVDLNFLTALLRAANPKDGGVFYDLGSGWGKAVFGTAALYPRLKKVVGIEYLPGLNSKATALQSKFSRIGGAPISFVNKDFTSVSVADADVIFAYASFYLTTVDGIYAVDVTNKALQAPIGARIITIDRKLKGAEFKLIKTIDDPSGDLQRVRGYVYEKVA